MIEFKRKDFLYSNGLVNIFLTLYDNTDRIENRIMGNNPPPYKIIWKGIPVILAHNSLIFDCEEKKLFEVYKFLIKEYYKNILENTKNLRSFCMYDDTNNLKVVFKNKIGVKPFASRIKISNLLPTQKIEKQKAIEILHETVQNLKKYSSVITGDTILPFKGKPKLKQKEIERDEVSALKKVEEKIEKLKNISCIIYYPPEKLAEYWSNEKIEEIGKIGESCTICGSKLTKKLTKKGNENIHIDSENLIYDFGESPPVNRDHRIKSSPPICFMCDLIYKYSLLLNFFWKNTVFIFDLWSLGLAAYIKKVLNIGNDYEPREDNIKTNIQGKNTFYIYNASYPKLLELLWDIYFLKLKGKVKKEIADNLSAGQIIMYDVTGEGVENSIFYNNLSYIIQLFEMIENQNLKDFFVNLVRYHYLKDKDKTGILQNEFVSNILFKKEIEKYVFEISYIYLSILNGKIKEVRLLNKDKLYLFLKEYNKLIKKGNIMEYENILKLCASLGERIGYFAAEVDNKSLLYSIREIGNMERLIEFFKEFEYEVLKANKDNKKYGYILNSTENKRGINKKYSEIVEGILNLSLNKNLINIMRDIIGIFAVQDYLSRKYAQPKQPSQGGE